MAVLLALLVACASSADEEAAIGRESPPPVPSRSRSVDTTVAVEPADDDAAGTPLPSNTTIAPSGDLFLWMPDGVSDELLDRIRAADAVTRVAVLSSGTFHLTGTIGADGSPIQQPPEGFVIPVEGQVVAKDDYLAFVDSRHLAEFARLDDEGVVLSEASAKFRQASVGDRIRFEGGSERKVVAILDDAALSNAEIVVTDPTLFAERTDPRQVVLIDHEGSAAELGAALKAMLPADAPARIGLRGPVQSGGAPRGLVRSQLFIKAHFGEFAYRPGRGETFQIDPDWVAQNIVDVDIPLLGPGKCHREFAARLTEVMEQLITDGLEELVDTYSGCWNPRYIAGSNRLSHHAWGIAADMNFFNPADDRAGSPVHPELLKRLENAGLVSGHRFTTPDPGHFEFYDPE